MIVDSNGEKLNEKKMARASIFVSDDGDEWMLLRAIDVPPWLKDYDIMGHMIAGEIISEDEDGPYYKAEKIH